MTTLAQLVSSFNPSSEFTPPANWLQGSTVYGGLSAALVLQTMMRELPQGLPSLKSGQIAFVAPASNLLRFTAGLMRR